MRITVPVCKTTDTVELFVMSPPPALGVRLVDRVDRLLGGNPPSRAPQVLQRLCYAGPTRFSAGCLVEDADRALVLGVRLETPVVDELHAMTLHGLRPIQRHKDGSVSFVVDYTQPLS